MKFQFPVTLSVQGAISAIHISDLSQHLTFHISTFRNLLF